MSYFRQAYCGGTWLIENKWGCQYEVKIAEVSEHEGLSFTGRYSFDGRDIGVGCFPMKEIRSMRRISG